MWFLVLINKSCHLKNDCIFVDSIYQKNWLWKRALTCSNSTSTTGNPTLLLLLLSVNCKNPTVNGFSYQVAKGRLLLTSHASFKVSSKVCCQKGRFLCQCLGDVCFKSVATVTFFVPCRGEVSFQVCIERCSKKSKVFHELPKRSIKDLFLFCKKAIQTKHTVE